MSLKLIVIYLCTFLVASRPPPTKSPRKPTRQPSRKPKTGRPSRNPSLSSLTTSSPRFQSSLAPTPTPSSFPILLPSSAMPIPASTFQPSSSPTMMHISTPTTQPSCSPTASPISSPTSSSPTASTISPTFQPSIAQTRMPNAVPTLQPSSGPTIIPTSANTFQPSLSPSAIPISSPTFQPSFSPTVLPIPAPTLQPSSSPTIMPISSPTFLPSFEPTRLPISSPSFLPSFCPTIQPSTASTRMPISTPTILPSSTLTRMPVPVPTLPPSSSPTIRPSKQPLRKPSFVPSAVLTIQPTADPTTSPSANRPTSAPVLFILRSQGPTSQPNYFDGVPVPERSAKRGIVSNGIGDPKFVNAEWYYNYRTVPTINREWNTPFVPMFKTPEPPFFIPLTSDPEYLLTFNEPDLKTAPAFMSGRKAASLWPGVIKYSRNAKLVAPAVTRRYAMSWLPIFLEGNGTYVPYVDYINLHWYDLNVADLLDHIDNAYAQFNLPIWITEYNMADWESAVRGLPTPYTEDDAIEFHRVAVLGFEQRPFIFRYSAYSDPFDPAMTFSCLYDKNDVVTKVGLMYAGLLNNYTKPRVLEIKFHQSHIIAPLKSSYASYLTVVLIVTISLLCTGAVGAIIYRRYLSLYQ